MGPGVLVVNEQGPFAGLRHGRIVFHHVRHLRHLYEYGCVFRFGSGQSLQLLVGFGQLAGAYERLRQVVAHLKVFAYLERFFVAFHCIVVLSHLGRLHSVVFEHVKLAGLVGLLFLFGCLFAATE